MSYKNSKHYKTRLIEVSLSSDQTISSTSETLINFDSIRGDSGHGVSLVSGQNGRIRLSAGKYYHIIGPVSMDKNSTSDQYSVKWWNPDGSQILESDGAFRSYGSHTSGSNKHFQCLHCQLLVNPTSDQDFDLKVDGETGSILKDGTMLFIIEMSKEWVIIILMI